MLHEQGQHIGAGVAVSGSTAYIVVDVAAYWGDAGLTSQPVNSAYGENAATQQVVSNFIAPVIWQNLGVMDMWSIWSSRDSLYGY